MKEHKKLVGMCTGQGNKVTTPVCNHAEHLMQISSSSVY